VCRALFPEFQRFFPLAIGRAGESEPRAGNSDRVPWVFAYVWPWPGSRQKNAKLRQLQGTKFRISVPKLGYELSKHWLLKAFSGPEPIMVFGSHVTPGRGHGRGWARTWYIGTPSSGDKIGDPVVAVVNSCINLNTTFCSGRSARGMHVKSRMASSFAQKAGFWFRH